MMVSGRQETKREIPWWLVAMLGFAVAFGLMIAGDADYRLIFGALQKGLTVTLFVAVVAYFLSAGLGLLIAMASLSRYRVLREVSTFYIELVRGVPVLVLLFYIAFVGAPQLVALYNWLATPFIEWGWVKKAGVRDFDLMWRAIFALSISYSAFIAEIFRAGIQSVEQGQIEAAQALGLKRRIIFLKVVFPQAIRVILPPLGNEFVAIVKDSALVSVLGVQDITQLGKVYSASTFLFFETYNVVAYIYLLVTVSLSLLIRQLEASMKKAWHH